MIRSFLISALALIAATPPALQAQNGAPLGRATIALKLGYVGFSKGVDQDDGPYVGLEGYGRIASRLYLGAEVGTASSVRGLFGDEMTLIPLEANLKYAAPLGSGFVASGGAGLSYSHAEFYDYSILDPSVRSDTWLFGGQVFADLVYRIEWFDFGINAKYQLIEDYEEVGADFSNLRLSIQLGAIF